MLSLLILVFSYINLTHSSIIDERYWLSNIKELRSIQIRSTDKVCESQACIEYAQKLHDSMDETVNPCEDFYRFSCGGYMAKHTIPEDKTSIGVYEDVFNELNAQLKDLIDKPLTGTEPEFVKMVKNIYDSCVNLENIEAAGSEPLKKLLDSLNGWPVVLGEKWDGSKFDWMDTIHSFRRLGISHNVLFSTAVTEDMKNNIVNLLEIDQASLGMSSRKYLQKGLSDPATKAYFDLMVKTANKLGADQTTSEKEMMDAFNFEIKLANYSMSGKERRNFTARYNKMSIKELQNLAPQVDWHKYISGLFDTVISPTQEVIVIALDYVKKTAELINTTDKRTIANYMLWRAVKQSLSLLSKDWRDLKNELTLALSGSNAEKPRWEECLQTYYFKLSIALSAYYIKKYFNEESKQKADELVKYQLQEYQKMLETIDWMDENTKAAAIEKAKSMTSYIGYPQELANDTLVSNYYQNLSTSPGDYFRNALNLKKWRTDKQFSKLHEQNIKGDWKLHAFAALVNAYYTPQENSIDFPAAILLKPFFNKDMPNYVNFGAIGSVIGHEITHGFDNIGSQFDKDGNVKNWWDETTKEKFKKNAECFISHFNNYTLEEGVHLNGALSQGENIADNGGLKNAYLAYQSWAKNNAPEPNLPGFKYSQNQMFWISNAYMYCGLDRPEYLKMAINTDPHTPYEFRVIGTNSNLAEFSNDFQCPLGSPMNPENKCKVF